MDLFMFLDLEFEHILGTLNVSADAFSRPPFTTPIAPSISGLENLVTGLLTEIGGLKVFREAKSMWIYSEVDKIAFKQIIQDNRLESRTNSTRAPKDANLMSSKDDLVLLHPDSHSAPELATKFLKHDKLPFIIL